MPIPKTTDTRLLEFDRRMAELERQAMQVRDELVDELTEAEKREAYLRRQLERVDRLVHRVSADGSMTH